MAFTLYRGGWHDPNLAWARVFVVVVVVVIVIVVVVVVVVVVVIVVVVVSVVTVDSPNGSVCAEGFAADTPWRLRPRLPQGRR